MKFYNHEAKVALFALTTAVSVHFLLTYQLVIYNDTLVNFLLNLGIWSLAVSLLSKTYLDGEEPGKYIVSWFWGFFLNFFFLGGSFYPFNLDDLNPLAWSFLFSLPASAITSLLRLTNREEVNGLPSLQMWSATVIYVAFFLFSSLIDRPLMEFMIPFFVISYLLSFFAIGGTTKYNLSLIGLVLSSGLLTLLSLFHTGLLLPLLVLLTTLAYYYLTMRVVLVDTDRGIMGGVTSSKASSFLFPVVIVVVWDLIHHMVHTVPEPNVYDFPVIFLPGVVGNVIVDTLKVGNWTFWVVE
ncbi:hypothetical protein [Sulfuracidifex tepidarius]|uniref:hypothetical protein n=1 Tax=Sulfuracidifex tepidarius TaxID=1294262 RepID=UPI0006CF9026|nr:hypothetical protein [Sulfuracidifex tepidarius]